jgi:hypothetical protein
VFTHHSYLPTTSLSLSSEGLTLVVFSLEYILQIYLGIFLRYSSLIYSTNIPGYILDIFDLRTCINVRVHLNFNQGEHQLRSLRSNVKNLFLNFPEPTSLSQTVSQEILCDNRLFEFHQEERLAWGPQHAPAVQPQVSIPPTASSSPTLVDAPVPVEIDRARFRPLTEAQRQYRRANGLCLYCGAFDYLIRLCPRNNRPQIHRANGL